MEKNDTIIYKYTIRSKFAHFLYFVPHIIFVLNLHFEKINLKLQNPFEKLYYLKYAKLKQNLPLNVQYTFFFFFLVGISIYLS